MVLDRSISNIASRIPVMFVSISWAAASKTRSSKGWGIERLQQYARALGYDRRSGIELKGEADGLIPEPDWKRINTGENWSTGDTYIASVGQGYVLATPLQILMFRCDDCQSWQIDAADNCARSDRWRGKPS